MIMAAADDDEAADAGGLELLGGTRLLLPLLLLPLPMPAALLLFDRLSCLLFFLPDDRDDVREAVLPNDATELLDDIRRMTLSAICCVCALLAGRESNRIESNRIGSNCIVGKFPNWWATSRRFRAVYGVRFQRR